MICKFKKTFLRDLAAFILEQIAEGVSWEDLLSGYPELHREDIHAALVYATASLEHMEIRTAGG